VEVEAFDRKHLLRDVTTVLGDLHISIVSASVVTRPDRTALLRFAFELADPAHLAHAMRSMGGVDGVYDVYRVVPRGADGAGRAAESEPALGAG
jgi:GTP diphosphokinase / guanosine-3',5'-bis(diphosphate) 3'-diphosphatase